MRIAPAKTPIVAKKMFPNYTWNIHTKEKELFLTFDDGPTPNITKWTLDQLKAYDAKATFFCIGNNIEKHPDIFKEIIDHGHAIGNHTQHHVKGWKTPTKDYIEEVLTMESTMEPYSELFNDQNQKLFRPPYGQIRPKQGRQLLELGYQIIMWDVLSFDWDQNITKEQCLHNVTSKSKPGSIIVFHDSLKASKNMMAILPKVLKQFSDMGFKFRALY